MGSEVVSTRDTILKLRRKGLSQAEIARELGVSRSRVSQACPLPMDDYWVWAGMRIRDLRLDLGMCQDDFARAVGVRWLAVSRWENSHAYPSWKSARALFRLEIRRRRREVLTEAEKAGGSMKEDSSG